MKHLLPKRGEINEQGLSSHSNSFFLHNWSSTGRVKKRARIHRDNPQKGGKIMTIKDAYPDLDQIESLIKHIRERNQKERAPEDIEEE